MKFEKPHNAVDRGFTLVELTFTVLILLSLIGISFAASHAYVKNSQGAGCVINQDKIFKVIVASAHMGKEPLKPGVDYCTGPDAKALFETELTCPEGGSYSAVLDADGQTLIITCLQHGHTH